MSPAPVSEQLRVSSMGSGAKLFLIGGSVIALFLYAAVLYFLPY